MEAEHEPFPPDREVLLPRVLGTPTYFLTHQACFLTLHPEEPSLLLRFGVFRPPQGAFAFCHLGCLQGKDASIGDVDETMVAEGKEQGINLRCQGATPD